MKNKFTYFFTVACLFLYSCSNDPKLNDQALVQKNADETNANGRGQSGVVDDVSQKNIVQVAASSKDHTTLVQAVQAGELVDALSNAGPFTVFAPTNEAFNALPKGTLDELLKPENKSDLQNILQYHVCVAVFKPENLSDGQVLGQVNGDNVTIHITDGKIKVNDANIIASLPASNGIIHVIDKVLLPPAASSAK